MLTALLTKREERALAQAKKRVLACKNVPQLCDALNAMEDIARGSTAPLNLDIEIPQFAEAPDVDWNDWAFEPVSCDHDYVMFFDTFGRFIYMTREDVEDEEQ